MKLCSLIFTLVVSIYGMEYSRHHHGLFKNPKAFVSSLNKIDKDTISGMITTVQGLIDDGETERASIQAVRDAALADFDAKEAARVAAETAQQEASSTLAEGETELAAREKDEAAANVVQTASREVLLNATVDEAAALAEKELQSARIDSEAVTLNEVKELITDISAEAGKALAEMNNGRKLLAVDYKALASADPNSIDEVIDLIDELLAAGETERATYVDAWAEANEILNNAQTAWDADYADYELHKGKVERQILDNAAFQEALDTKVAELGAATRLTDVANDEFLRQDAHLDAENIRLDKEKETCEEIIDLLENLLGEESEDVDEA